MSMQPTVVMASNDKRKIATLISHMQNANSHDIQGLYAKDIGTLAVRLDRSPCDVLLLDAAFFEDELVLAFKRKHPAAKVIVLAAEEKDYVMDALSELSIDGYLSMGTPLEVYSKAIQAVVGGELWLPRSIIIDAYRGLVQRLKHQAAVDVQEEQPTSQLTALTEREKLVSKMIANGLANKEIAREMGVSINTVKKHLKNIYGKCNVSRRSQIAPLLYQGAAA